MKKNILLLLSTISLQIHAQTVSIDSIKESQIYYKLGVQYKDGSGVPMDYKKAFDYFSQAASLGDVQSVYAIAYMQYKGLGCLQDYKAAAQLFAKGADIGKDNSMYFYGLCWRNGYGVAKNEDSAKYWLQKSADLGYVQAFKELEMTAAENSNDSAKKLLQQISNAAIPITKELNRYQKIQNHLPPAEVVTGYYKGYIIQYDWSGQNVLSSKKLSVNLSEHNNQIEGTWSEDAIDSFKIRASLHEDSLSFNNTQYARKDHYSPDKAVKYNFQNAKLNLVQKGDTVFLAGNIAMFSPERKEPSKPIFVALYRLVDPVINPTLDLRVSPNPFKSAINVEFTLLKLEHVEIQLLTIEGRIVYTNPAGTLEAGHYLLPLQPGSKIASGIYLVKVVHGNKTSVVKVEKN